MYYPGTWSNWDVNSLSYIYKVPQNAAVLIRFYDNRLKQFTQELQWEHIERLGEKSLDGQYFDCAWRVEGLLFDVSFAAEGDAFVLRLLPRQPTERYAVLIGGALRWNAPGQVSYDENGLCLKAGDSVYRVYADGADASDMKPNDFHSGYVLKAGEPVYCRCNLQMTRQEMDAFIENKRAQWEKRLKKSGGDAEDVMQAIARALAWNTVYEPGQDRFVTPVTRRWCSMSVMPHFGNYVLFAWDTFFGALLAATQDKEFAERQVESILEEFRDGCIPLAGSQVHIRSERSQPPVGSYCTLKLYHQYKDKALLEKSFERLAAWNAWWFQNRDGNRNGLLEWGVNQSQEWPLEYKWLKQDADYESGMDNSPMHDGVPYNMQTQTLEQDYVELNALYALDCRCLAEMAALLDKPEQAQAFTREYQRMAQAINTLLWNDELGIYCSRRWDGSFNTTVTPGNFYPMLAGVVSKEREQRMIDEWLCNPQKFYGDYMLPAVTRDHPAYRDNDYWRGRVWGPTNYLVAEGLRLSGYERLAGEIAQKSLDMFLQGWKQDGHMHENYNADTGRGDDVENSDPFYTWSGLLPYLFLTEQADTDMYGRLHFGTLEQRGALIEERVLAGHIYRVDTMSGLHILRDGKVFMDSDHRARVDDYEEKDGRITFRLQMPAEGRLTVQLPRGITHLTVCGRGGAAEAAIAGAACITWESDTPAIRPGV